MIDKENMEEGWYYSQEKHGVEICHWDSDHKIWDSIFGSDEVLAPVPSYEEWQATEKYNKHLEEVIKTYERKDKQATETSIAYNELAEENDKLKTENKWYSEQLNEAVKEIAQLKKWCEEFNTLEVAKENAQLKELLKECRHIIGIEKDFASCHFEEYKLVELLTKIDEALK